MRGVPTRMVYKSLALLGLISVTFLVMLPDLHNSSEFWRLWVVTAPILTFFVVRLSSFDRAPLRTIFTAFLLVALWLLAAFAIYHRFHDPDPHLLTRARYRCEDNLRRIAGHLEIYASSHGNRYPDRFEELLEANAFLDGLPSDTFVTPFSLDTPATGATTREVAAQLSSGGHNSYIYLGKGLTSPCPPNTVLVYEPLSKHARNINGIHVLYDGQPVAFLPEREARKLIAELESGHNPPRPEKLR
ncbi:MAG: hypothetical protein JWN40_3083 [Phycisphaerales bacterium]|nr:hypothetical protein [Phycisphaerales bacterium]